MIMSYEMFLFSQLFMCHVNVMVSYEDLAYDIIYPEVIKHRELFLESKYNVDTESEYDCINNYLTKHI